MKKLVIGLAAIVVVVAVVLILLVGNLDKIIKGALEEIGSELFGVPVKVAAVEIKIDSGAGQISGLSIANPSGYSAESAFQMDMIRLEINLGSLGKQPLVIDKLTIKNPVVQLDVKENGNSNLQTLMDNMEENSATADKKATEKQQDSEAVPKGEPIRMAFGQLTIIGVTVHIRKESEDPETVIIPDIVLHDVGQETGLTPAELGKVVVGKIFSSSLENALKKKITEQIEDASKGFLDQLKNKLAPKKSE